MTPKRLLSPEDVQAEVNRLLAEPPRGLVSWLATQKLELADALPGPPHAGNQQKNLKSRGLFDAARLWVEAQRAELKSTWKVSNYQKVNKQLCLRFVDAWANKQKGALSNLVQVTPPTENLDWASPSARWVAQHPGLAADREDDQVKLVIQLYERENPCPGDYARNLYNHCEGKREREGFFVRMEKQALEARKKGEGDEKDKAADAELVDMNAEFDMMLEKLPAAS